MEPGDGRFAGRNIVILGAGQRVNADPNAMGNSRAMSLLFAREGAAVACVDIDTAAGEETARRVQQAGVAKPSPSLPTQVILTRYG